VLWQLYCISILRPDFLVPSDCGGQDLQNKTSAERALTLKVTKLTTLLEGNKAMLSDATDSLVQSQDTIQSLEQQLAEQKAKEVKKIKALQSELQELQEKYEQVKSESEERAKAVDVLATKK
jgi:hypothetical protein